jgi:hypothetical protein
MFSYLHKHINIKFTVTRSGLEGQLLGLAIQHEQPKLEKEKGEMLKKEEDFKVQLATLEKELLQVRLYVYKYTYIYVYVYMYICTYIHIYDNLGK